jgi:hypothetical protein
VQSDLEEENDHAQLGQSVNHRLVWIEQPEHGAAEDHTGHQLAEHRWLSRALSEGAKQLRRSQQRGENQQQLGEGVSVGQD